MRVSLVAFYVLLWSLAIASPVSSGTPYTNNFNDSAYSEVGRITDMRGRHDGSIPMSVRMMK